MLSIIASASRASSEPLGLHASSYCAFRITVWSSVSLRDCSAAIVKTVDMEFSSVVLAAPTIRAVMRSQRQNQQQTARLGRRARRRTGRGENRPRGYTGSAENHRRSEKNGERRSKMCAAHQRKRAHRPCVRNHSKRKQIGGNWLYALCSAESIAVKDSLTLNAVGLSSELYN